MSRKSGNNRLYPQWRHKDIVHKRGKRSLEARRRRKAKYGTNHPIFLNPYPPERKIKNLSLSDKHIFKIMLPDLDKNLQHPIRVDLRRRRTECYFCGESSNPDELEVHHRDKNRENNKLENLLVLCRPCHRQLHAEMRRVENGNT